MMMSSPSNDEHERTSLLASSPRSSPPPPSQHQGGRQSSLRMTTMTGNEIRRIQCRADRLVEDCVGDVDDDDDSRGPLGGRGGDADDYDDSAAAMFASDELVVGIGPVSTEDLEILTSIRTASTLRPPGRDQQGGAGHPSPPSSPISDRVRLSTRKLRDSVHRGSGRLPRLPSHAEIEGGGDDESGRPPPGMVMLPPRVICTLVVAVFVLTLLVAALLLGLGALAAGPPLQPVGEYRILEAQEGENFWEYYDFYAGKDSAGSNGYITYVSKDAAEVGGIIGVSTEEVPKMSMIEIYEEGDARGEVDWMAEDLAFLDQLKRTRDRDGGGEESGGGGGGAEEEAAASPGASGGASTAEERAKVATRDTLRNKDATSDSPPLRLEPFNPDDDIDGEDNNSTGVPTETFVIISSSSTPEGPRNSVRLEGLRRFNRGLFIIDLRHMPAGCGTWPAFWLTDEANWPVNGKQ